MRTRSVTAFSLAIVASLLMLFALAGVATAAETRLTAQLAGGAAEVPPGDPDGSGTASFTIDPQAGTLCFEITTQNIAAATASHIHIGGPGVAGEVLVPLTEAFEGTVEDCIEPREDAAPLQSIVDNPGGHYVNVHNAEFPGGAVRGQLAAMRPSNTATPARAVPSPIALLGLAVLLTGASALAFRAIRVRSR